MSVQTITVNQDEDGLRVDRWFSKHFPQVPHGMLQKWLRKGHVRLDGKRVKANDRIAEGQSMRIPPMPDMKRDDKPQARLSKNDKDLIKSMIMYQDDTILVLNKPDGLAVQGGTKTKQHIDHLLGTFQDQDGEKPKLVHRLDKDTSGLLLVARTRKAAQHLGRQFKEHTIRKYYWALTVGVPEERDGEIIAPLAKGVGDGKERVFVNGEDGQFAKTLYSVLDHASNKAAWLALWPRTGRTHQLRAHTAFMGCPILGDGKYGGSDAKMENLPMKMHLHAQRVIFTHPKTGKIMDIKAPLPDWMAESWKFLGFETKYGDDPFDDVD